MKQATVVKHNRTWETVGFIAGMLLLIGYAVVELYVFVKCHFTQCNAYSQSSHLPLLFAGGLLIAPKMIGRARAGKLAEMILTLRSGKSTASVVMNPTEETKNEVITKPPAGGE
ncbi:MAG TPA: hypothetical protein VIY48_21805 [Candidatus Paceibacterota bacterium]